ncbi:MAG: bifunctional diguanylate cyclase/phosphodiesterase [Pseudomonadota bacterium]
MTARMSVERRLWWAANHDPVTSLPNRLLFEDRLAVAIQRSQRDKSAFALAVVEVSDFASLNPHSGYAMPDRNMLDVAGRLDALTRDSDTVARLSINEFALVLNGVSGEEQLRPEVDRMSAQIADLQSSAKGGDGIVVSVGVAFFPIHATTLPELVRAAELALAQAKRRLDSPVIIYNRKMANDVERKRETVLTRARASLARHEFVPFYQPQIDIETNQIVGVEALVRWQTNDTILDAKDFAYALDDHEIGGRVGRAVLDQVIADLSKLRQMTDRPFRVSINASRTEVLRNDFLDTFLQKARAGHLQPSDFIIEITEDVIIGVDDRTLHDKLSFLVSSGVEFSLDDFGTGYASLIHITSFPVAEIKIDKQFIAGIESDFRKKSIVRGIVGIARSMGLNLIAEGVETPEQQETLRDIGCRYVQGYLYSFPVPFAQFSAMLQEQQ